MFEQALEKFNSAKEELQNYARNESFLEFKKIFEKYPNIKQIRIVGYTPYWNDGDVCTFRSYIDDFEYHNIGAEDWRWEDKVKEEFSILRFFEGNEAAELIFGNSFEIIVTNENLTIEEFQDHD